MNRYLFTILALLLAGGTVCHAQKKQETKIFEESSARMLDPEVRVFITPQICDMEMLSEGREIFGPYRSEERRGGKDCTIGCRNRWSPYN